MGNFPMVNFVTFYFLIAIKMKLYHQTLQFCTLVWYVLPGCELVQFNFSLVKMSSYSVSCPESSDPTIMPLNCLQLLYLAKFLHCSYTSHLSGMATTVLQRFFTVKSWSLSSSSLSKPPLDVACPATMSEYGSFT